MLRKAKPATYIGYDLHATSFSCLFEGKESASGHISINNGAIIGWEMVKFEGKLTIYPAGGRQHFAPNPREDKKIVAYIERFVNRGDNVMFPDPKRCPEPEFAEAAA